MMKNSIRPPFGHGSWGWRARLHHKLRFLSFRASLWRIKAELKFYPMRRALRWLVDWFCLVALAAFLALVICGVFFAKPHQGSQTLNAFAVLLRWAWPVFVLYWFVEPLWTGKAQKQWHHFKAIRPGTILQNLPVVVAVVFTSVWLSQTFPALNGSWLHLLPVSEGGQAINLTVAPLQLRWVGPIFFVLLCLNVPYLASLEEEWFRRGTRSWPDALRRSLAFGLVHCIMGVTVAAGLALSLGGLWFSWNYFRGGEERSTLHHATYNLIGLSVLGLVLAISAIF